jgi:hypothetical protein
VYGGREKNFSIEGLHRVWKFKCGCPGTWQERKSTAGTVSQSVVNCIDQREEVVGVGRTGKSLLGIMLKLMRDDFSGEKRWSLKIFLCTVAQI